MSSRFRLYTSAFGAVALLASCGANGTFDPDLRGLTRGPLDTAQAASVAQPRPTPDARGLISYPDYQVVIARKGDTVATIAARLGLNAGELAQYNAIDANTSLAPGAVVALPRRVASGNPAPKGGARSIVSSTGQVSDPFAGQGQNKPEIAPKSRTATSAPAPAPAPATTSKTQPRQHKVASGETAWSIARRYNVSVTDLAKWNGLPSDMTIRVGQRLLIPVAGQQSKSNETIPAPGSGSPTPRPPSSSEPLPAEKTQPVATPVNKPDAPDLGSTRTAASGSGKFQMPVAGSIIRPYQKGRNDGIDISAPAGSAIKAAASGTVAAITKDTEGVPIVVIRHSGDLMTVYAGMGDVKVSKGTKVDSGQRIGTAGKSGVLHFEIRKGFESVDPEKYLN